MNKNKTKTNNNNDNTNKTKTKQNNTVMEMHNRSVPLSIHVEQS